MPTLDIQKIVSAIHWIRGYKVMLDAELARFYGVETKYLKRQVNRNSGRFPSDFMFRLTKQEVSNLRCQIGTLDRMGRGSHSKYLPYAFTEHGILMLSSVLGGSRAVHVNIAIMRAFVRLREILSADKALAHKFVELEKRVGNHDAVIQDIIVAIRKMLNPPVPPKKPKGPIGFHP